MSWVKKTFSSSIGSKLAMALSAFFLLIFLLQHLMINLTSVVSPDLFNELSHFMGTNFMVQAVMQPILLVAVLFHFIQGFRLELKNKAARNQKYAMYKGAANATWVSRNMIYSGLTILAFFALHFIDFWIPEIMHKYVHMDPENATRYFPEMVAKFENPVRVGFYVLAFVFLALHLMHGFQSAFQSVGMRHPKYLPMIQMLGKLYSILIPAGFIFIAIFHFVKS